MWELDWILNNRNHLLAGFILVYVLLGIFFPFFSYFIKKSAEESHPEMTGPLEFIEKMSLEAISSEKEIERKYQLHMAELPYPDRVSEKYDPRLTLHPLRLGFLSNDALDRFFHPLNHPENRRPLTYENRVLVSYQYEISDEMKKALRVIRWPLKDNETSDRFWYAAEENTPVQLKVSCQLQGELSIGSEAKRAHYLCTISIKPVGNPPSATSVNEKIILSEDPRWMETTPGRVALDKELTQVHATTRNQQLLLLGILILGGLAIVHALKLDWEKTISGGIVALSLVAVFYVLWDYFYIGKYIAGVVQNLVTLKSSIVGTTTASQNGISLLSNIPVFQLLLMALVGGLWYGLVITQMFLFENPFGNIPFGGVIRITAQFIVIYLVTIFYSILTIFMPR